MSELARWGDLLGRTLAAGWGVLLESAPYMMLGLVIAALGRAYVRRETLARMLARPGIGSILRAALIGVPLPLCSCGVLPTAVSMRRRGASRGATVSFLVSTPETGVDSIAVTWALLDPVMTIARPVAAFITAVVAGLSAERTAPAQTPGSAAASGGPCGCSCAAGAEETRDDGCESESGGQGLREALRYVFLDFIADIGPWFLLGVFLAGVVVVLVPPVWVETVAGGGLRSMLLMLIVGIPVYICASASTPIAAALLVQGASPGAALVFLLAGPATNVASIIVLVREMGGRVVGAYLASIALCSLGLGLAVDALYARFGWPQKFMTVGNAEWMPAAVEWLAALALILFVILGRVRAASCCDADHE